MATTTWALKVEHILFVTETALNVISKIVKLWNIRFFELVSNGNRTEWSPILSVIIRVMNKSDSRCAVVPFCYHSYYLLQSELDSTRSYYHH